ncbi:type I DNA topoisomerase [Candidatus Azambacteria bacterium]|nr:type I DNA topoisomerase [Candidatus Azambacteria bacterium]
MPSKSKNKKDIKLVIVESPTKAKTITKFLDSTYFVTSSFGHIRDLPKSKIGVDVEHDFEPHYIIPRLAKPRVKALKEQAKKASEIILATDEDREGEAIAWHIAQILDPEAQTVKLKARTVKPKTQVPGFKIQDSGAPIQDAGLKIPVSNMKRITFHEITKPAIEEALTRPRVLDMNLVNAQQARRVLDRLVGYELSPFLWKKLVRGLSAGRVQSAALRIIVEREEEIKKFIPQPYWTVEAQLKTKAKQEEFPASLISIDGKKMEKFDIKNADEADALVRALKDAAWHVSHITKKEFKKTPPPPFTTSTLQQEAGKKIRFSAKQTMMAAQQLYEGVELPSEGSVGLITYMRTDSVHCSENAITEARNVITQTFGKNFALAEARKFKTRSKGAQEAHEAIRPTDPKRHPDSMKDQLSAMQWKLYNLIWRRFIASQMEQAVFDTTAIDIAATETANKKTYVFRANGVTKKFAGFLEAYPMKFEDTILPDMAERDALDAAAVHAEAHATQPPPRYSEASLVKALEEHGIGRPSTYAPTISTIQARGYVEKNKDRRLAPTEMGVKVNAMLVEHFPQIVDIAFTAKMEEDLDSVAEGKAVWQKTIREFYEPFHKNLELKYEEVKKEVTDEKTDEVCEKCGSPMIIKMGRFGKFLACSKFPECKNTKTIKKTIGMRCPLCNEGDVVEKRTKKKRTFWGCSRYPACTYASWENPLNKKKEEPAPAEPEEEESSATEE